MRLAFGTCTLFFALSFSLTATTAWSQEKHGEHGHHTETQEPKATEKAHRVGSGYPLSTCLVSGKPLDSMGGAVILNLDERQVRLCCKGCVKRLELEKEKYLAKLDQAVIADQAPRYPLTTCPVSGEKLGGEMGPAIDVVVGDRLVRVCCKGCVQKVKKSPGTHTEKIVVAVVESQREHYPLKTCLVSGQPLTKMGKPIDYVHGTTLVRLCCAGCIKKFEASPSAFLEKLPKAHEKKGEAEGQGGDTSKHGEKAHEKHGK